MISVGDMAYKCPACGQLAGHDDEYVAAYGVPRCPVHRIRMAWRRQ